MISWRDRLIDTEADYIESLTGSQPSSPATAIAQGMAGATGTGSWNSSWAPRSSALVNTAAESLLSMPKTSETWPPASYSSGSRQSSNRQNQTPFEPSSGESGGGRRYGNDDDDEGSIVHNYYYTMGSPPSSNIPTLSKTQSTSFWDKFKWPIIIVAVLAVSGIAVIILLKKKGGPKRGLR